MKYIIKYERPIKTFFETFCAYISINILSINLNSKEAIKGLVAGAIASAISVAINYKKEEK